LSNCLRDRRSSPVRIRIRKPSRAPGKEALRGWVMQRSRSLDHWAVMKVRTFRCQQAASRTSLVEECVQVQYERLFYERLFGMSFAVLLPARSLYCTPGTGLAKVRHLHRARARC